MVFAFSSWKSTNSRRFIFLACKKDAYHPFCLGWLDNIYRQHLLGFVFFNSCRRGTSQYDADWTRSSSDEVNAIWRVASLTRPKCYRGLQIVFFQVPYLSWLCLFLPLVQTDHWWWDRIGDIVRVLVLQIYWFRFLLMNFHYPVSPISRLHV